MANQKIGSVSRGTDRPTTASDPTDRDAPKDGDENGIRGGQSHG